MKTIAILLSFIGAACAISGTQEETSSTEEALMKCYFDEWDGGMTCEIGGGCTITCWNSSLASYCISGCH